MFKNSSFPSQRTKCFFNTKTKELLLFRQLSGSSLSDVCRKHKNNVYGKEAQFLLILMLRVLRGTWTDYKTNTQITKELKITPILDKIQEYKRSWIQHVNRMPRNRLPRLLRHYSPTGRRNHGRPLKRLLDT